MLKATEGANQKEISMKKSLLFLGTLSVILAVPFSASSNTGPTSPVERNILPDKVFIPAGFDDNDRAQIITSGNLMNTCHKIGPVSARIDHDQKKVFVTQKMYVYPGEVCVEMLIPYTHTVDLGVLPSGNYEIVSLDPAGAEHKAGSLPIATNVSSSADDFLYAPIEQAFVDTTTTDHSLSVILSGHFPNNCMKLKEVKVLTRTANIIELLPITEMVGGGQCENKLLSFQTKVEVKGAYSGTTLVHIRTMNGKSMNQLVDLG
jgi:hypothetical protein